MALMAPSRLLVGAINAQGPLFTAQRSSLLGLLRSWQSFEHPANARCFSSSSSPLTQLLPPTSQPGRSIQPRPLSLPSSAQSQTASQAPHIRQFTTSLQRQTRRDERPVSTPYEFKQKLRRLEDTAQKFQNPPPPNPPPQQQYEQRNQQDPEDDGTKPNLGHLLVWPVVTFCVILYAVFQWAITLPPSNRKNQVATYILEHFTVRLKPLLEGNIGPIFGGAFFHPSLPHLAFNMFAFGSFLPTMFVYYGGAATLYITILSQLGTAGASLYWRFLHSVQLPMKFPEGPDGEAAERMRQFWKRRTLFGRTPDPDADATRVVAGGSSGMSGVICGYIAAIAFKDPRHSVQALFFIPMPVSLAIGGFGLYGWWAMGRADAVLDHPGHVGGIIMGLVGAVAFRKYGSVPVLWQMLKR